MALTSVEEAQTRDLIAQQAALLSLASSEATILSKLGATKKNISEVTAATVLADADLMFVRQGTTDKSVSGAVLKTFAATTVPDATDTVKGIVELATLAEVQTGTDSARVVTPLTLKSTVSDKIQPVDATVAANALTVTINPTTLDFRSATLTSGAVNTRVISSAINCVVPSGATLGTINAVQSRIVILAIDNAGTVESAVVNITGGNDLSETGVISTTALSTGSDSANIFYSTTARTNVAYRVVGFIDSTQSTAGTWATAPSAIQGYGGQAFASMSSFGYGQTWQNVTGSRVLGTTYYNTTGKPIQVSCTTYSSTTASIGTLTINGVVACQHAQPSVGYNGISSAIVPPGASYVIAQAGTGAALYHCSELR